MEPNVAVQHLGSLVTIQPLTASADAWLRENTDGLWWGDSLVCEPRYVNDILEGLADGVA